MQRLIYLSHYKTLVVMFHFISLTFVMQKLHNIFMYAYAFIIIIVGGRPHNGEEPFKFMHWLSILSCAIIVEMMIVVLLLLK